MCFHLKFLVKNGGNVGIRPLPDPGAGNLGRKTHTRKPPSPPDVCTLNRGFYIFVKHLVRFAHLSQLRAMLAYLAFRAT